MVKVPFEPLALLIDICLGKMLCFSVVKCDIS